MYVYNHTQDDTGMSEAMKSIQSFHNKKILYTYLDYLQLKKNYILMENTMDRGTKAENSMCLLVKFKILEELMTRMLRYPYALGVYVLYSKIYCRYFGSNELSYTYHQYISNIIGKLRECTYRVFI